MSCLGIHILEILFEALLLGLFDFAKMVKMLSAIQDSVRILIFHHGEIIILLGSNYKDKNLD